MYYVGSIPYGVDDLQHYGVLGMKWGVRKDPKKAYEKALKKKNKLENRIMRYNKKVAKYEKKTLSPFISDEGYEKAQRNATKFRVKQAITSNKSMKWVKQMEKVFSEIPVSQLNEWNQEFLRR